MEKVLGDEKHEEATDEKSDPELDHQHAAHDGGHGDSAVSTRYQPNPTGLPLAIQASHLPAPKICPANPVLPDTVTMLEHAPSGGRVYIVGTTHVGKKSQEDVALTIRTLKPDSVMLELCSERVGLLTSSFDEHAAQQVLNGLTMEGVKSAAKEIGFPKAIMGFLMLKLAAVYVKKFGMAGGDMRTACREAAKIPHCTLQLGDRAGSITVQRAMNPLSLRERLQLVGVKIRDMRTDIFSQENVEKRRWRAVVEELRAQFAAACPTVYRAIVQERDVWLAEALKRSVSEPVLTAQGPRGRVTVGVVGIAHVAGIQRAWNNPPLSQDELRNLMTIPPPSAFQIFAPGVMLVWSVSLGGYGAYRGGRFVFNHLRGVYRYLFPATPAIIRKRRPFAVQRDSRSQGLGRSRITR